MVARFSAAGALLGLLALAFAPVLFGGQTLSASGWLPGVLPTGPVALSEAPPWPPPVRDLHGAAWVNEPAPYLVHAEVARGEIPLWNDREGLGIALLGNPNMGAFSPLQLAPNLFPSSWTQDLSWLLRVFLLGIFTLGLVRELGGGWLSAIAAATAIMLSGQTVQWIEHHPLNTDVFVPAALWAALALPRMGRSGVAWLALAVAAGLLGVKPQSAILGGLFGLLWLVAAVVDRRREGARGGEGEPTSPSLGAQLPRWAAGVLLGAGLAAVALVPFQDTFAKASGLVRAGRTAQAQYALPVEALPELGGPLVVAASGALLGTEAPADPMGPMGLPYAGLVVLLGATVGFWRSRHSRLSWALAATVLVEVLRVHGLLPIPLSAVPLLGSINYVKYCFPLYLALALLLARAFDGLRAPLVWGGLALVVAELLWLMPPRWPERVDPYVPARWVDELRRLDESRPGRISGPVDLAPPLVSGVLGFRDLRSIDVLTPRDTYDFVSRLISPSLGITWILADPDPLLAATGPGANLADLRWILSSSPLREDDLPAAVRAHVTSRRLTRLFDQLESYAFETRVLGGGLHDSGGDRRFHWSCETPCRFVFDFRRLPAGMAMGLAAPEPTRVEATFSEPSGVQETVEFIADDSWRDLWHPLSTSAEPGRVEFLVTSDEPAMIFLGGVGPAPEPAEEARREARELEFRRRAFADLELRWHDRVAHIYENPAALGEAAFARRVVLVEDRDAAFECVAAHAGERVACVPGSESGVHELLRPNPGEVRVVESSPERLLVETRSDGDNLLLVSRVFDPDWRATIDGAPAEVRRVDGALMGLLVPAGAHEVEIAYVSRSFRIGLLISILSAGVFVLLLVPFGRFEGPKRQG